MVGLSQIVYFLIYDKNHSKSLITLNEMILLARHLLITFFFPRNTVKGTPIQIWKSPYMLVSIWKQWPESFAFLILRIFQLFPREHFWKSRLIFILFYCFWMWNLQHIAFVWRQKYWQIFKPALVYL